MPQDMPLGSLTLVQAQVPRLPEAHWSSGDLKNLVGRIVAIIGDGTVEVLPENLEGIKDPIPVNASQLRKHFKVSPCCLASNRLRCCCHCHVLAEPAEAVRS